MLTKIQLIAMGVQEGMKQLKIGVEKYLDFCKDKSDKQHQKDIVLLDTEQKVIDNILKYNGQNLSKEEYEQNVIIVLELLKKMEDVRKESREQDEKNRKRTAKIVRKVALAIGTGGLSFLVESAVEEFMEIKKKIEQDKIECLHRKAVTMALKEQYFKKISSGEKLYEVRLYDKKRAKIDIGDNIEFVCENTNQKKLCKVEEILRFSSFKDCIKALPLDKLGFDNSSASQVLKAYGDIYSEQEEKEYGVVAFKLNVE